MAKRRGVFTVIGTLAIIMIVVASIIAVSQSFVTLAGLQLPTILTDMPTFHEYDDDGAWVLTSAECNENVDHVSWDCMRASEGCTKNGGGTGCETKETGYLRFYWFLAQYSLAIMMFVVAISVMEYVMSGTGFTNVTDAIDRIKKVIPFMVIIAILPIVWDPVAIFIENVALFLMAPFPEETDIGLVGLTIDQSTLEGRAAARSAWLWMEAGHIVPPSTWDPQAWSVFLSEPARFIEETIATSQSSCAINRKVCRSDLILMRHGRH